MIEVDSPQNRAFQFFPHGITALIMILVFTVVAAEFAVGPAIQNLPPALQATGLDLEVFERIGHQPVFGKGVKEMRQIQAS